MEYKEMGYESVLTFMSTYLLQILFLTYVQLFFFMVCRKIVAEFEQTITQIMGKFHIYTLSALGGWDMLSLELLNEGSTLSSLTLIFKVLPGLV